MTILCDRSSRLDQVEANIWKQSLDAITMMKYLTVAVAIMLAACQTPTPYQPAIAGHGYWDEQTGENTYRVVFTGNAATPRDTVEDYLLLRSAELAVEQGYERFFFLEFGTDEVQIGEGEEHQTCAYAPYFYYPYFPYVVESGPSQYTASAHVELTHQETRSDNTPTIKAIDVISGLNGCL